MLNWCASMRCIKRLNFCRNAHFQRTRGRTLYWLTSIWWLQQVEGYFSLLSPVATHKSQAKETCLDHMAGNGSCWRKTAPGDVVACRNVLRHANIRTVLVLRWPHWVSNWRRILLFAWQPDQPNHEKTFTGVLKINKYYMYIWYMNIFHILVASRWCLPLAKHVKELCDGNQQWYWRCFLPSSRLPPCMVRYSLRLNNI